MHPLRDPSQRKRLLSNLRKVFLISSIKLENRVLKLMRRLAACTCTDNSVSIHQRNLQLLVTEIYRTKMNINPSFMKEIFVEREIHYNLRVMNSVYARKPRTTAYGLETVSFLGQNLWRDLPLHRKKSQSVKRFKKHIKFGILYATVDYVRVLL